MNLLDPRLKEAVSMCPQCDCAADIACDHGKLGAVLLLENRVSHMIDTDISEQSLKKAMSLSEKLSLSEKTEFRIGDGLKVLKNNEVQTIFLMGIGGTLMREILSDSILPLAGAQLAILQPMTSQEDIRLWLFQRGYHIQCDKMVREGIRFYQVFSVLPPDGYLETRPDWWPDNCWSVGYRAAQKNDPVLKEYLEDRIHKMDTMIQNGAPLEAEKNNLEIILRKMGVEGDAAE